MSLTPLADTLLQKPYPLKLPEQYRDDVEKLVRAGVKNQKPGFAPFSTKLDVWIFSIAVARHLKLEPIPEEVGLRKFVDTASVRVPERHLTCLLSAYVSLRGVNIGREGSRALSPNDVFDFGNRLAAAGIPEVVRKVSAKDFKVDPLHALMDFLAGALLSEE